MVYLGSKSKYTQYIVPILQKTIDDNNDAKAIEKLCRWKHGRI